MGAEHFLYFNNSRIKDEDKLLLYVQSSVAIILMGKRELVDLLSLFSPCLVIVV